MNELFSINASPVPIFCCLSEVRMERGMLCCHLLNPAALALSPTHPQGLENAHLTLSRLHAVDLIQRSSCSRPPSPGGGHFAWRPPSFAHEQTDLPWEHSAGHPDDEVPPERRRHRETLSLLSSGAGLIAPPPLPDLLPLLWKAQETPLDRRAASARHGFNPSPPACA